MDAAIELRAVHKAYGDTLAVRDVSLIVQRGELFSLLGPSGCGKTTTLRIIAGLDQGDSGSVHIFGQEVAGVPPHLRHLGMVFQSHALFPHLTVHDNVAFGLDVRGSDPAQRSAKVADALRMVRLDPAKYARRRHDQLSGGEKQRVALARALVIQPRVLLLDEPLGALDRALRLEMQQELKRLNRALGITFVMVTHDQEEALSLSDRIAVMSGGQVLQVGTPREIYERPRTERVARFIGEVNTLELRLETRTKRGWEAAHRGGVVLVPDGPGLAEDRVVRVAIRPEWLGIYSPTAVPPGENVFTGEVTEIVYLGDRMRVGLRLESGDDLVLSVRNEGQYHRPLRYPVGSRAAIAWHPQDAVVLEDEP